MKKIISLISILIMMNACSAKKIGVDPHFVIYPYDFYEKFNLRTIISSYRLQLQNSCLSYPKDFFEEQDMRVADNKFLALENTERKLMFEMVAYNQVIITDQAEEGGYESKSLYTFFYNKQEDDFRVDEFFIRKNESCTVEGSNVMNKNIK